MSKRRKAGDIVRKKKYAGFVGESSLCRILPEMEGAEPPACWVNDECQDPECKEWSNLEALDAAGNARGHACHVSECEMEDAPNEP